MKRSLLLAVLSLSGALSTIGCVAEVDDPAAGDEPAEATIAQTVVVLDPDGSVRQYHRTLTQDELAVEVSENNTLRANLEDGIATTSQAITLEQSCANINGASGNNFCSPTCAGSSMWIWDSSARNNSMVCFYGTGQVDLSTVTHYVPGSCGPFPFHPCNVPSGKWNTNVKSFWAGTDGGNFSYYPINYCLYSTSFAAGANVSSYSSFSNYLTLGDTPCHPS